MSGRHVFHVSRFFDWFIRLNLSPQITLQPDIYCHLVIARICDFDRFYENFFKRVILANTVNPLYFRDLRLVFL